MNQNYLFMLWGTVMTDQRKIDVKARGFQVNIEQRGTMSNEKARNVKQRGEKLQIWKP